MSNIRFLTEQISCSERNNSFTLVIAARNERWKEALLLAWVLAWTTSGVFFMLELGRGDISREMRIALVVFLFFWAYFEIKTVRALFWRLWGFEQIRFTPGQLTYKRSIKGYGKRYDYFLDNIDGFKRTDIAPRSFVAAMEDSFWVVGGERIYFEHLNRKQGLAMQLSEEDSKKLIQLLNQQLHRWKRKGV